MICEHCYGKGERGSVEWRGVKICPNCQGCGIVHCCEGARANPHFGSTLEDFLEAEGILGEATEHAIKTEDVLDELVRLGQEIWDK